MDSLTRKNLNKGTYSESEILKFMFIGGRYPGFRGVYIKLIINGYNQNIHPHTHKYTNLSTYKYFIFLI